MKIRLKLVIWTVNPSIVGVVAAKVGRRDEPEVSRIVWSALVNPLDAKVTVYADPGVPKTPRLVKVTMPDDALWVVVPSNTPPLETVAVTEAVEEVTVLPLASWILKIG